MTYRLKPSKYPAQNRFQRQIAMSCAHLSNYHRRWRNSTVTSLLKVKSFKDSRSRLTKWNNFVWQIELSHKDLGTLPSLYKHSCQTKWVLQIVCSDLMRYTAIDIFNKGGLVMLMQPLLNWCKWWKWKNW